jgi:hypothetical protein
MVIVVIRLLEIPSLQAWDFIFKKSLFKECNSYFLC